jgi:3-dehydroquinate synthase
MTRDYAFGSYSSRVVVGRSFPDTVALGIRDAKVLLVCDSNTEVFARRLAGAAGTPVCALPPGEEAKGWPSVEAIVGAGLAAGLGRDGIFVGVGGGVVTDLVAFAASVYMRGARLVLVPTTLLAMADAALGGKTGFDLFGLKNLIGTFRPADGVHMATEALGTLPRREWISGLAEVIKTAVIGDETLLGLLESQAGSLASGPSDPETARLLPELVARCVAVKGRIVEADPTETGSDRALLNLGHTFGHALESSAGLGALTHGEAVAWGMARACAFGVLLGITPPARAERLTRLLAAFGYETGERHSAVPSADTIIAAMSSDKKKKDGRLKIIVPGSMGAVIVDLNDSSALIHVLGGTI